MNILLGVTIGYPLSPILLQAQNSALIEQNVAMEVNIAELGNLAKSSMVCIKYGHSDTNFLFPNWKHSSLIAYNTCSDI